MVWLIMAGICSIPLLIGLIAELHYILTWNRKCERCMAVYEYQLIDYKTFKLTLPFTKLRIKYDKDNYMVFQFQHVTLDMFHSKTIFLKFPNCFSQWMAIRFYKSYMKRVKRVDSDRSLTKNASNEYLTYCRALLDSEIQKAQKEITSATSSMKTILNNMAKEGTT